MDDLIRIFVVDDLRLLREGLVSLLAEQDDITVIGTAASGGKALEKIKELRPDVALIDIGMPGKDGLTVTQMSVLLAVSPGRSDFWPQLSLSYDSGTSNGIFGFGWSLSLPSITRKTDQRAAQLLG